MPADQTQRILDPCSGPKVNDPLTVPGYNEPPARSDAPPHLHVCVPGLLISIYPFIKAWLNINHALPAFGESLAASFKHNF